MSRRRRRLVEGRGWRQRCGSPLAGILALTLLCLVGCGSSAAPRTAASGTGPGGPQNHTHAVLALGGVPNTLLLATHVGLFRSADGGSTWREVAGGDGQVMSGLMTYQLTQSRADPLRVYVLGIPRAANTPGMGTPGIYTSADAGLTWNLATPLSAFSTGAVAELAAGTTAEQLFAILPRLGNQSLMESDDTGGHWHTVPLLPTNQPTGILADPGHTGRMLLWSASNGLYFSDTNGLNWQSVSAVQGGVYWIVAARMTLYVYGEGGLLVSTDGGTTFAAVHAPISLYGLATSDGQPHTAFAFSSSTVYVTTDAGRSWMRTATTTRQPAAVAVDAADPSRAVVGLSFPVGVDVTSDQGRHWSLTMP